jgi:hypothetical protein
MIEETKTNLETPIGARRLGEGRTAAGNQGQSQYISNKPFHLHHLLNNVSQLGGHWPFIIYNKPLIPDP